MITDRSLEVPVPGELVEVVPRVMRLTAPNPSVMTGPGTNTYLVGERDLVAIDPGPVDEGHLDAIAAAAETYGRLKAVIVTHTHSDHAPGAKGLAERSGAVVLGFDERAGFVPDVRITEGDVVDLGDLSIRAVHTPGHASDHLCYVIEEPLRLLFSGDHIMGGSTVVIAPPDGNMADYLASLDRLLGETPAFDAIVPGHGPVMSDPIQVIAGYKAHRLARESAVLGALEARRAATIEEIVADVYTDVPELLHPIARFSVWAHLRKLRDEGRASSDDPDTVEGGWAAIEVEVEPQS
ncbi:MAG: MBL fold metallo-hydrolase [Acidimicrobiales bacterium]